MNYILHYSMIFPRKRKKKKKKKKRDCILLKKQHLLDILIPL